jgi:hypothetical protein
MRAREAGMNDSQVFLINVTNLALGLAVLGSLVGTVLAVAAELAVRTKRKLESDAELRHPFRHLR